MIVKACLILIRGFLSVGASHVSQHQGRQLKLLETVLKVMSKTGKDIIK